MIDIIKIEEGDILIVQVPRGDLQPRKFQEFLENLRNVIRSEIYSKNIGIIVCEDTVMFSVLRNDQNKEVEE